MNKLFTSIAVASLSLTMAVGVGVAVGQSVKTAEKASAATGDTFVRVSSVNDISDGDVIIFVNQAETYACSTTQNSNNRGLASISVSSHQYTKTASDNVQEFTVVAGSTSGQFGFHTGSGYIYSAASSSNYLRTNSTAASTKPTGTSAWTLAASNNVFTINNATNTSYYLAVNGTTIFSQYKTGQSKPYIFKKSAATASLSLDKESVTLYTNNTDGVTVTATVSGVSSPTYSWTTTDTNISLENTSTKTVTIKPNSVSAGSATVNISVGGTSPALTASVAVTLKVAGPGETPQTAYSIAQAVYAIDNSGLVNDVYVTGIISQIDQYYSSYHSITYWISDDGTTTNQFEVYSGKNLNNTNFNALTDIELGAEVIVFGSIKKYTPQSGDPIYEFNQNNYLVSYVAPTITVTSITDLEGTLTATVTDSEFDLSSLIAKGTLSNTGATILDITNYVSVSTVDVPNNVPGPQTVSVTVSPKDGGISSESFDISATIVTALGNVTISNDTATIPSSYGVADWTSNSISGKVHGLKSGNNIQLKAGESYAYNIDSLPGYITSIVANLGSGSYRQLTAYVGTSPMTSQPASGGINNDTDWKWSIDPDQHYTYFFIKNTSSNAAVVSSIVVTYQDIGTVDPTGINLNENALSMDSYGSEQLIATVEPFNANDKTVTWSSSNENVATVDEHGLVSAVAAGNATITAKTANDIPTTCSVTVTQAEYLKGMYTFTSTSNVSSSLDYPSSSTATGSSSGNFSTEKQAVQVNASKNVVLTLSGYDGQKIVGFDLMMASNDAAGAGSLTLVAGTSNTLYEIEATAFSNEEWNGSFNSSITKVSKDLASVYTVQNGEDLVLTISGTINSLYLQSVSIRYIDGSLETWCQDFLTALKGGSDPICKGVGITDTTALKAAWDDQGLAFLFDVSEASQNAAAGITADEEGNTIEQALYLYDWCVMHYDSTICDRFISGRSANNAVIVNQSLFNSIDSQATTAIIVVVALTSVTAIGAIFFIRRRKYN